MNPYIVIICLSLLIICSHFFQLIAKKTNIPAVLMLMVSGLLCQWFIPQQALINVQETLSILGNIGLILIVLEASLDLRLTKDKIPLILKALASSAIGLVATAILAAGIIQWLFPEVQFYQAMLVAVPFAVMSSAIVIPSVANINSLSKEFMIYESSISDILGIIFFYLFLDINQTNTAARHVLGHTALILIITIVLAIILSFILIYLFSRIKSDTKLFLMISALLFLFALGKLFHLSSLILILIFGLILGNPSLFIRDRLARIFNHESLQSITGSLHHITLESSFVLKTFFFFIFGLSINLIDLADLKGIFVGVSIVVFTYVLRYLVLRILVVKNLDLLTMISPRGLISILLFFNIPASLMIEHFGNASMLITIFLTNGVMAFGLIQDKGNRALHTEEINFTPTPSTETTPENQEQIDKN